MTTAALIAELQRLDPEGTREVEVPVRSYTAAYPHAYLEDPSVELAHSNRIRLTVSFPKGFVVSQRKG